MKIIYCTMILAITSLLPGVSVVAQEPQLFDDLVIEEIVVTAQKREQKLQDVPIAITAIGADEFEQTGSVTLSDIAQNIPSLTITQTQYESISVSLRGISSNDFGYSSEESIPVYLDGVYQGVGSAILGGLQDIARIEVLKGPQGTLFGRNAAGGAVNVTTAPVGYDFEARLNFGMGNYDLRTVKSTFNLPLIQDTLGARINVGKRDREGWQKNVVTSDRDGYAQDRWNARIKVNWTPTDSLQFELTNDWLMEDDHPGYSTVLSLGGGFLDIFAPGTSVNPVAFDTGSTRASSGSAAIDSSGLGVVPDGSPLEHQLKRKIRGTSLKAVYELNDELTLTSITSYRELDSRVDDDPDGTEFALQHVRSFEDTEEYNYELRLNGQHGILDWFLGANAYRSDTSGLTMNTYAEFTGATNIGEGEIDGTAVPQPFDEVYRVNTKTESYGVFGDAIFSLAETVNATLGARYSRDVKSQDILDTGAAGDFFALPNQLTDENGNLDPGLANLHENWDNLSLRAVVDVQMNDDLLGFFSVSQGYKSGGFNSFPLVNFEPVNIGGGVLVRAPGFGTALPGQLESFDEEQVINYELGLKSTLLDGSLRVNASYFYYEYDDLQVQFLDNAGALRTDNLGEATGQGVDLDVIYLVTGNLTLSTSLAWLDTRNEEDLPAAGISEGDDLAFAPSFSGSVAINYLLSLGGLGDLRTNLSYSYTGDSAEDFRDDSFELLNARITLSDIEGQVDLAFWGRNITNEDYLETGFDASDILGFNSVRRNEPATYGIELIFNLL